MSGEAGRRDSWKPDHILTAQQHPTHSTGFYPHTPMRRVNAVPLPFPFPFFLSLTLPSPPPLFALSPFLSPSFSSPSLFPSPFLFFPFPLLFPPSPFPLTSIPLLFLFPLLFLSFSLPFSLFFPSFSSPPPLVPPLRPNRRPAPVEGARTPTKRGSGLKELSG